MNLLFVIRLVFRDDLIRLFPLSFPLPCKTESKTVLCRRHIVGKVTERSNPNENHGTDRR